MGSIRECVMLAYPVDERRLAVLPEKVFMQRKLNGERARVVWSGKEPVIYSSCNNEMPFFKKVKEELKELNLFGLELDGEFYKHGMPREEIHSICSRRKNPHPNEGQLSLHIFDLPDNMSKADWTQDNRLLYLDDLDIFSDHLSTVETVFAPKKEFLDYADLWIREGYEGAILRHPKGLYTPRKTGLMLKFKPTEQDTYPIVGFQEEVDIAGFLKGRLGAVLVKDDDGHVFSVGTGNALDAMGREYWWRPENRIRLNKCLAVVKHSPIRTVNGFPTCTSLLKIEIKEEE
jgi:ATP-dependent DNA ligase